MRLATSPPSSVFLNYNVCSLNNYWQWPFSGLYNGWSLKGYLCLKDHSHRRGYQSLHGSYGCCCCWCGCWGCRTCCWRIRWLCPCCCCEAELALRRPRLPSKLPYSVDKVINIFLFLYVYKYLQRFEWLITLYNFIILSVFLINKAINKKRLLFSYPLESIRTKKEEKIRYFFKFGKYKERN